MSFLNDLFDEASTTALDAHTPNPGPGGTWAAMQTISGGSANPMRISAGTGYAEIYSGQAYWRNNATPPTADYHVEAIVQRTAYSDVRNGPIGRFTVEGTHYRLELNELGSALYLVRMNGWTPTVLDDFAWTPANGTFTLRLEMIGAEIKGYMDGVERVSATDGSPITGAGYAGIASGGMRVLSVDAVNLGTAPSALVKLMQMMN
jgi:hypothetical protein